ncbi:hypothetical protein C8Q76DRAFT_696845 [Earliella scabrosa]|nr:hypothetical protein C8Q76DRAFT_696845 [Earliella scabrosa]
MVDPRVKEIVKESLPTHAELQASLHRCPNSKLRHHRYGVSYGVKNRYNVGKVFEFCGLRGDQTCVYDGRLLPLQVSVENALRYYTRLSVMDPPPFHDVEFGEWCGRAAADLNAVLHLGRESQASPFVTTPSRSLGFARFMLGIKDTAEGPQHVEMRAGVIKPRQPRVTTMVTVPLAFYERDWVEPRLLDAQGRKEGSYICYSLRQPEVLSAWDLSPTARKIPGKWEMYEPIQRDWQPALPASHVMTLLPGQGVIYRKVGVKHMVDFPDVMRRMLPDVWRADEGRIPSFLNHLAALVGVQIEPVARITYSNTSTEGSFNSRGARSSSSRSTSSGGTLPSQPASSADRLPSSDHAHDTTSSLLPSSGQRKRGRSPTTKSLYGQQRKRRAVDDDDVIVLTDTSLVFMALPTGENARAYDKPDIGPGHTGRPAPGQSGPGGTPVQSQMVSWMTGSDISTLPTTHASFAAAVATAPARKPHPSPAALQTTSRANIPLGQRPPAPQLVRRAGQPTIPQLQPRAGQPQPASEPWPRMGQPQAAPDVQPPAGPKRQAAPRLQPQMGQPQPALQLQRRTAPPQAGTAVGACTGHPQPAPLLPPPTAQPRAAPQLLPPNSGSMIAAGQGAALVDVPTSNPTTRHYPQGRVPQGRTTATSVGQGLASRPATLPGAGAKAPTQGYPTPPPVVLNDAQGARAGANNTSIAPHALPKPRGTLQVSAPDSRALGNSNPAPQRLIRRSAPLEHPAVSHGTAANSTSTNATIAAPRGPQPNSARGDSHPPSLPIGVSQSSTTGAGNTTTAPTGPHTTHVPNSMSHSSAPPPSAPRPASARSSPVVAAVSCSTVPSERHVQPQTHLQGVAVHTIPQATQPAPLSLPAAPTVTRGSAGGKLSRPNPPSRSVAATGGQEPAVPPPTSVPSHGSAADARELGANYRVNRFAPPPSVDHGNVNAGGPTGQCQGAAGAIDAAAALPAEEQEPEGASLSCESDRGEGEGPRQKRKGRKGLGKRTNRGNPDRDRTNWKLFPRAEAFLNDKMKDWLALDPRDVVRDPWVEKIANSITTELDARFNSIQKARENRQAAARRRLQDAVQSGDSSATSMVATSSADGAHPVLPPKTAKREQPNPLLAMITGRKVSPTRLWASHHNREVRKKAGSKDIGPWSAAASQLWKALPEEVKNIWEDEARKANEPNAEQYFIYVKLGTDNLASNQLHVLPMLADFLKALIGMGPQQAGRCIFYLHWACEKKDGGILDEEVSVADKLGTNVFSTFEGGPPPEEEVRWQRWVDHFLARRPTLKHSQFVLDARGRPILPPWTGQETKDWMVENLVAWFEEMWDWTAVTRASQNFVSTEWTDTVHAHPSTLDPFQCCSLYMKLAREQNGERPFSFLLTSRTAAGSPTKKRQMTELAELTTPHPTPSKKIRLFDLTTPSHRLSPARTTPVRDIALVPPRGGRSHSTRSSTPCSELGPEGGHWQVPLETDFVSDAESDAESDADMQAVSMHLSDDVPTGLNYGYRGEDSEARGAPKQGGENSDHGVSSTTATEAGGLGQAGHEMALDDHIGQTAPQDETTVQTEQNLDLSNPCRERNLWPQSEDEGDRAKAHDNSQATGMHDGLRDHQPHLPESHGHPELHTVPVAGPDDAPDMSRGYVVLDTLHEEDRAGTEIYRAPGTDEDGRGLEGPVEEAPVESQGPYQADDQQTPAFHDGHGAEGPYPESQQGELRTHTSAGYDAHGPEEPYPESIQGEQHTSEIYGAPGPDYDVDRGAEEPLEEPHVESQVPAQADGSQLRGRGAVYDTDGPKEAYASQGPHDDDGEHHTGEVYSGSGDEEQGESVEEGHRDYQVSYEADDDQYPSVVYDQSHTSGVYDEHGAEELYTEYQQGEQPTHALAPYEGHGLDEPYPESEQDEQHTSEVYGAPGTGYIVDHGEEPVEKPYPEAHGAYDADQEQCTSKAYGDSGEYTMYQAVYEGPYEADGEQHTPDAHDGAATDQTGAVGKTEGEPYRRDNPGLNVVPMTDPLAVALLSLSHPAQHALAALPTPTQSLQEELQHAPLPAVLLGGPSDHTFPPAYPHTTDRYTDTDLAGAHLGNTLPGQLPHSDGYLGPTPEADQAAGLHAPSDSAWNPMEAFATPQDHRLDDYNAAAGYYQSQIAWPLSDIPHGQQGNITLET